MEKAKLNISIDGGALTKEQNKQYGNYVFTRELVAAFEKFDKANNYTLYLQNEVDYFPRLKKKVIKPKVGWLKLGISLAEFVNPQNVFLAINQALPFYTKAKKIVFCHGLAPIIYPELYPDSADKMRAQIDNMLKNADKIVVGSQRLKNGLNDIIGVGKSRAKIEVINYGVGDIFLQTTNRFKRKKFLLYVGSNHPIKNLRFIFQAFLEFGKLPNYQNYKLILAGVNKSSVAIPKEIEQKTIVFEHLTQMELYKLYNETKCLVSASLYESFNLPVLEALSQNTMVVATSSAIIPELEKYVQIAANSPTEFSQTIKLAIEDPLTTNLSELKKQFSWQTYVKKLISLYE
jgi:glycosyltransferase involved in cell wall biosynthesis